MKTLHAYIIREILGTLFMAALVLTLVFVLGSVVKEIMVLLLNRQVSLWLVLEAVGLLVPFVLAFVFPMALLTSTLLVFGRFSADLELTAARAGGISLISLASPVLLLSIGFSVFSGWINLDLAPRSRAAYLSLMYRIGAENPSGFLVPNQYQDLSPTVTLYTSDIREIKRGEIWMLENVDLTVFSENGKPGQWLRAPTARFEAHGTNCTLTLTNSYGANAQGSEVTPLDHQDTFPIVINRASARSREPSLSDMTFSQLRAKRRDLEHDGVKDVTPVLVQMHRQAAFSFACVGFTLIGIPLGVRAHRRETSAGVAMALLLVLVYYSFIILSQSLATRPEFGPQFIVWIPNFIFQVVGGFLLWKANRS